jgi:exodeoxyribonuclease V alpha subunit
MGCIMKLRELEEWASSLDPDEIGNLSTNESITGWERSHLYRSAKKLRYKEPMSLKQLKQLQQIYFKIKDPKTTSSYSSRKDFMSITSEEAQECEVKHLCIRMAWHDNKWNGKICKNPQDNLYCVGENSLLSDRIRRRRNLDIECREELSGSLPDLNKMDGYQPPCFWSINAFGNEHLEFVHDNPVAADFPHIPQPLPPYSVISWPFKLSFVKDANERRQYNGSYYPKEIFEKRIRLFQRNLATHSSIVFLYCKFSNPISGEDMDYLVAGCALLKEKGKSQRFKVTPEELEKTAKKLKQPNFPSLNWALRYTIDFENTGVRLPYHEYLDLTQRDGGISEDFLRDIAVTIQEPELVEGFTYVAKHVDDDQAIYLLMKIRKSILAVREHSILDGYDTNDALEKVEELLRHAWVKRGYFPGIKNLISSIPGVKQNYLKEIHDVIDSIDTSDPSIFNQLSEAIENQEFIENDRLDGLFVEIGDFLDEKDISSDDFLRLASLNLTEVQYIRILSGKGTMSKLYDICRNPYLLFEEYIPSDDFEDKLSGEKIDGPIDLFKVDISLFPVPKYLRRIKGFHNWKVSDHRRLRSVIIEILKKRERVGDCYLESENIGLEIENYPLFYKIDTEYKVNEDLANLTKASEIHFKDKIVFRKAKNRILYYLKEVFDDEVYIGEIIKSLLAKPEMEISTSELESDLSNASDKLSKKIGQSFDKQWFVDERRKLYKKVLGNSFFILSGSPGAGKSYELLKLIDYLRKKGETYQVLSLTGKAVLRLKNNDENFKNINAKTIDKFLADVAIEAESGVHRIINNLIIDESSMVDLPKLASILRYIDVDKPSFKRLILVGDENQLPPIGFGKPFADVIQYLKQNPEEYERNYIYLESNCRAELPKSFLEFTSVFSGENKYHESFLSETNQEGEICDGGVKLVFWSNKDELYERISLELDELYAHPDTEFSNLISMLGVDSDLKTPPQFLERFQVISPYKTGYFGVSGLNLHFQTNLRKDEKFLYGGGDIIFKLRDKVMHTKNEYKYNELFVSNGSFGSIVGNKKVFFIEREKPIFFKELRNADQIELAYGITVHKSQGSGFNHVFVVLPNKSRYLSRELLYTALTRTRNKVTIFIQKSGEDFSASKYLDRIRSNSSILRRRTSLLYDEKYGYAYTPDEGVVVKSRVEYIIYRKLLEAREKYQSFSFNYEELYELTDRNFDIHPDFVLYFDDGRKIYWEHLGRVTSKTYMTLWDKRRKIYEDKGDLPKVVTTDELKGISDDKIEQLIKMMVDNNLVSEDSTSRYSEMHLSLR